MDVKTLYLGVLSIGDASGYVIKNIIEGASSHVDAHGFGSIYPVLAGWAAGRGPTCGEC